MDINYYKKYEPIDGKWYITKELGSGAFGTVFEIERRDFTNDKSALKIITIPASSNEVTNYREENYTLDEKSISSYFYGFVEEFVKEFKLMSKLKGNSNIVSIEDYDVREHTDEIGWDILIRMELLTPMNKYFAKNSPKTRDVIKLGIDICKALEVCQKFNIVHRDIKPSNIFVSATGEFKLGDFGVARTLEKTSSGLSKKGTYTYMAPEVYRGEAYSSNVDLYSLGIVMYRLLNNNMEPFKEGLSFTDADNALARRMKGEDLPKPVNAEGRLAEIILKACSFNPKERYESPLQMRSELESICPEDVEQGAVEDGLCVDYYIPPEDKPEDVEDDSTHGLFDNPPEDNTEEFEDDYTRGLFDNPPQPPDTSGKHGDGDDEGTPVVLPSKKRGKLAGIIGAVVVGLLLCGFAIFWFAHPHSYGDWVVAKAATCYETGIQERKCFCGAAISEEIPTTVHNKVDVAAVTPTCTEDGTTAGVQCSICKEVFSGLETVPKTGHNITSLPAVAPTCTEKGKSARIGCSKCDYVESDSEETAALGHKEVKIPAVAATCTMPGKTEGKKCSVCNTVTKAQEAVPVVAHSEVTIPAVAATCTMPGKTEGKKCSVCNTITKAQEAVPVVAHSEVTIPAVAATCTAAGKTEGKKCSVCNTVIKAQTATAKTAHKEVVIPAVNSTCQKTGKTEGSKCVVCDTITVYQEAVPKKNHRQVTIPAIEATCKQSGKTKGVECSVCGYILTAQMNIPKRDHSFNGTCYCKWCGIVLRGDVNGDGKVSNSDLDMLRNYLAGGGTVNVSEGADFNGDGKISITDLSQLTKLLA